MPDLKAFLERIAQIESAKGKYTNHPVMQHGIHKGMHAIGQYGLMPLTAQELAKSSQDPEVASLAGVDPQGIEAEIKKHPGLEEKLAQQLAQKVLAKQKGDELRAAYAWNQGHNLSPENITDVKLQSSPYAQKYQKLIPHQPSIPTAQTTELPIREPQSEPIGKPMAQLDPEILQQYIKDYESETPEEIEPRAKIDTDEDDKTAQIEALRKFLG